MWKRHKGLRGLGAFGALRVQHRGAGKVVQLSAQTFHIWSAKRNTCALLEDGSVRCWGPDRGHPRLQQDDRRQ